MLSVAYAQECPLIATGCSPSHANGVQTSSIFSLVMAKITSPGLAFFDLAHCSSNHRGVLVSALHEEPLGNVENLLGRLLRALIACHGHPRPCYRDKHTMSGVRAEKGWRQKSPTAVTASLETRPTMDGEPERQGARARRLGPRARKGKDEPMGYMLETRGLTKRFGRGDQAQDAVADVSLHIREGEVYGLLGPNGAGKSTTLKMICGMLRPTAGEILFAGHAWRREDLYAIGVLIEEAPLYPNLTARENLRVRTTLLGLPESRVDEALAAVGLADTGKKRAGRFSMGMRQRLGLALALIARPRLLVLDEPTNGLDPIGIEELRDQIRGFAAAGTTVIVSSHILSEVQQMADTIGIIYGGRLAYEDALRPGQDLEELFMSVCREGRRARGEVAA